MAADYILDAEGIRTGYGKNTVVENASLHVTDGEAVCIIGPNGAGKSTILKALTGYLPCWDGSVRFKGEDITGVPTHELIARGISIVPQGRVVFPDMTVSEHLDLGAWTLDDDESERNRERVYEIFPRIQERLDQKAKTMSGGEQQMVSLGRALILDPDLLVLDEPSLGLAPNLVDETFELINTIQESGVSILMVEQNAARALRNTDRGYVVEQGEIAYEGESRSLLTDERIRELYLGG
jgi:branched-chain amino acid transport system ATP-binding protein